MSEKEGSDMARDIILNLCDSIKSAMVASDIEEMCRYEVAQEMEYQDRILEDNEIEDIVDDVVRDEAIVDPISNIDDEGVVNVTDIEWENIPDSDKVTDTDGDESLMIEGAVHKVSIRKDDRIERIASRISKDIDTIWRLGNLASGINIDKESYKRVGADISAVCPDCGSANQTVVWYDDDMCVVHCNDCDAEYETALAEDEMSVEERTVEDIPIYEDENDSIFGSVFYDGELGWTWQIWHNGECIEQQLADDAGEAYGIFNAIRQEYESLAPGEIVKSVDDGSAEVIEDVSNDDVVIGGRVASRIRIATDIAMDKAVIDDSDIYDFDVEAGDCYKNLVGEEIEVIAANGQEVLYLASEFDDHTHDYRSNYQTAKRNVFVGYLIDKGYLS